MKLFKKRVIEEPVKTVVVPDESAEKAALVVAESKIQAETDLKNIEALMTQEKQSIDLKYKDAYDEAQRRLTAADAALEAYAHKTKESWGKKSCQLGQCKLAFRAVKKLNLLKGYDWEKVGQKGLKLVPEYFKKIETVEFSKDKLKDLDAKTLTKLGLNLEVSDVFSATVL